MIQKTGTYFGKPIILACDAKCHKAWGMNNRPRVYLDEQPQVIRGCGFVEQRYPDFEEGDGRDIDNHAELADHELPDAPEDTGIYEGGEAKPRAPEQRLNKWCARECERSVMVSPGEDIELPDYNHRFYNFTPHTRPDTRTEPDEPGERGDETLTDERG